MTTTPAPPTRQQQEEYRSKVRGSILAGAVGDALGGPVEFWSLEQIRTTCGASGVREYVAESVNGEPTYGRITDDTQMTLFTIEGLIRASLRLDRGIGFTVAVLHESYDTWLDTQQLSAPDGSRRGWLAQEAWLYARRAPGSTCLSALGQAREGERVVKRPGALARNDSKGCGGVMRVAPIGLLPPASASLEWVFDAAATSAGYTHGHVTGRLASGATAALIGAIMHGYDLPGAVDAVLALLRTHDGHEETTVALERAVAAAHQPPSAEVLETLGGGWIAEEALAIAVYAALAHPGPDDMLDALALAVTHSGDSDSTGAVCGNILGALHGETAVPPELAFELEGRGTILTLIDDFIYEFSPRQRLHGPYQPSTRWVGRY